MPRLRAPWQKAQRDGRSLSPRRAHRLESGGIVPLGWAQWHPPQSLHPATCGMWLWPVCRGRDAALIRLFDTAPLLSFFLFTLANRKTSDIQSNTCVSQKGAADRGKSESLLPIEAAQLCLRDNVGRFAGCSIVCKLPMTLIRPVRRHVRARARQFVL